MAKKEFIKEITPEFRLMYESILEAEENEDGTAKFHHVLMGFDPKTDLSGLKKALLAKVKETKPALYDAFLEAFKTQWPNVPEFIKGYRQPFQNGDEKENDAYHGLILLRAKTKKAPGIVDRKLQAILDADEIYAGMFCKASLSVYAYETIKGKGNKPGFSFGLLNVQKTRDGDRISSRSKAEDDFDQLEDMETPKDDIDDLE